MRWMQESLKRALVSPVFKMLRETSERAQRERTQDCESLQREAFSYFHQNYHHHEFMREYGGFPLTCRQNDISRQVLALECFLNQAMIGRRSLRLSERIAILRAMYAEFNTDRVAMVVLAKTLFENECFWEAFSAGAVALRHDAHCEMTMSIMLPTLQKLPQSGQWISFFRRADVPSVTALASEGSSREMLDFLSDFIESVVACDAPKERVNFEKVHSFHHRWWKAYRADDAGIGAYLAHSNGDPSRRIAALRHVVEFASYRRTMCVNSGGCGETPEWLNTCTEIVLPIAESFAEVPARLLVADYLGRSGMLDLALDYARRATEIDTVCLLTNHVHDYIERARKQHTMGKPSADFSLAGEPAPRFRGRFCQMPFENAFINPNGDTFLCCPSLLPVPVGNIFDGKDWDAIWNSPIAQEIRSTVLNGTFKYCSKRNCHFIVNDSLPTIENMNERWRQFVLHQSVYVTDTLFADLGYDASCNLACQQCRIGLIVANRDGLTRLDAVRDTIIDDLLSKVRVVRINSGGEALFSRHFRKLLGEINEQSCPQLTHLELLTNGMLFNRRQWDEFSNLHYLKILVAFSIDAGTEQTFETVRRYGRWKTLCQNLEFASILRGERKIMRFHLVYVVQAANYRELPDTVRMAEDLGVDNIELLKLENMGTYSEQDYRSRNVVDPSHPLHQDFLDVISDRALGSPLVNRHNNLGPFVNAYHGPPAARAVVVIDPYFGEIYASPPKLGATAMQSPIR